MQSAFPDRRQFLFQELAQRQGATIGAELPRGAVVTVRPIHEASDAAVYGVTIQHDGRADDLYAYLESRGTEWRLGSIRGLALPPLYYQMLDSLEARRPLPDSDKTMLATMRLAVSSDAALRDHFRAHRDAFGQLARMFVESQLQLVHDDGQVTPPTPAADRMPAMMREAVVATAMRDDEHPGCLLFSVGGMLDNEVGYLFAPPDCRVPEISPHDYILVEPIAPGWYLYKTT